MKKAIIGLFAVLVSVSVAQAQDANVLSAWEYMNTYDIEKRNGNMAVAIENLIKAKESIDAAAADAKTSVKSKTWKRRVEIYLKILNENDPAMAPHKNNIMDEIYTSIQKARTVELNERTGKPKIFEEDDLKNKILYFSDAITKVGGDLYSQQKFAEAGAYFEKRYTLLKEVIGYTDTITYSNMFLSAYRAGDEEKAVTIGNELMKMNYDDPNVYGTMAQIYQKRGEGEKGLQIIKDARQKFPTKTEFITEELNYYLMNNDNTNAVRVMSEAIEAYKDDQTTLKALYFNSGVIFSNLKDIEKSREYYNKALAIDPTYYGALNNLASSYLDEANELVKKANDLPMSEQKKYEEMRAQAKEIYKKAGDLLEKGYDEKTAEVAKEKDPKKKLELETQLKKLKVVLYEIFSKMEDDAKIEKYKVD